MQTIFETAFNVFWEQNWGQGLSAESRSPNQPFSRVLNFSKWHLYVITCLGITWFFDGYEVSLMSLFAQDI